MKTAKIIVTGASGFLGSHLMHLCDPANVVGLYHTNCPPEDGYTYLQADLTNETEVEKILAFVSPRSFIHAAAQSNLDWCEKNPELAWKINAGAPVELAKACSGSDCKYLFVSSDMVFDGEKGFYTEYDPVNPISLYGRAKVAAEEGILAVHPDAIIARAALIFGLPVASGRGRSFLSWVLDKLEHHEPVPLYVDQYRTPVEVCELAGAMLQLVRRDFKGILNMAGAQRIDRYTFGECVCEITGRSKSLLKRTSLSEDKNVARRPRDLSLQSDLLEKIIGRKLSDYKTALVRILREK
jgi:dTDP-4-dehydrorhamnose reductase